MAIFQRRAKTVGVKRYDGKNAQEVADFLNAGSGFVRYTAADVDIIAPIGYWAVKHDTNSLMWYSDDMLRQEYQLTTQGKDESIPDDYR